MKVSCSDLLTAGVNAYYIMISDDWNEFGRRIDSKQTAHRKTGEVEKALKPRLAYELQFNFVMKRFNVFSFYVVLEHFNRNRYNGNRYIHDERIKTSM